MEISKSLQRAPLVSNSGLSQGFGMGHFQYDQRKLYSSSTNYQRYNALGQNSPDRHRSLFVSAGRRGEHYKMGSLQKFLGPKGNLKRACSAGTGDASDENYLEEHRVLSSGLTVFPTSKPDTQNMCWPEPGREEHKLSSHTILQFILERKINQIGLPLSIRMLKRKYLKQLGLSRVGETAYCSVEAAFSSMVFMIRELHRYTIEMGQYTIEMGRFLAHKDIKEMLSTMQKEMHASFVWLFQQVFSCTPSLMVSVMLLMANFTVYSMGNNLALAAIPSLENPTPLVSIKEIKDISITVKDMLANLATESHISPSDQARGFADVSYDEDILSIEDGLGGGGIGGRNSGVAGGAEGDSNFDDRSTNRAIFSEDKKVNPSFSSGFTSSSNNDSGMSDEKVRETREALSQRWQSFLKESYCHLEPRDLLIDHKTKQMFVSPIKVRIEPDDYDVFDRTNLYYQQAVLADPMNPLLLYNYARFLHLVKHDHDKAREYFQRAIDADRGDGEIMDRYAHFLWLAIGDVEAAEEAFIEAISTDPGNSNHAATYAHFLWFTGGEDTCYPIA